jgi:hypothetical protein
MFLSKPMLKRNPSNETTVASPTLRLFARTMRQKLLWLRGTDLVQMTEDAGYTTNTSFLPAAS